VLAAQVLTRPPHALGLRPRSGRAAARALAPQPPRLRQTRRPLDAGVGGRGERGRGDCAHARERGDDPPDLAAPGHWLEARQALDHQPRPRIRPKTGQRDRLIALAAQHPDWALGFADETWWSRCAQPQAHAWADAADGPLRLVEL